MKQLDCLHWTSTIAGSASEALVSMCTWDFPVNGTAENPSTPDLTSEKTLLEKDGMDYLQDRKKPRKKRKKKRRKKRRDTKSTLCMSHHF